MESRFDDGSVSLPYGAECDGRLHYGSDGRMSAHLWDTKRHVAGHVAGDVAYPAYFSYSGRWSLSGDVMTHCVTAATDPTWAGTEITRDVAWHGDDLLLSARVEFSGKNGTALLRWRKLTT
jgi:hypothetical protein